MKDHQRLHRKKARSFDTFHHFSSSCRMQFSLSGQHRVQNTETDQFPVLVEKSLVGISILIVTPANVEQNAHRREVLLDISIPKLDKAK